MRRFHVHVAVKDLQESIRFYSAIFATAPCVVEADYAKWMLEDPRLNFAISQRGAIVGINHLGLQAETDDELDDIHANLQRADATIVAEKAVHCCYANSDKYWVTDPQGIAWESFRSLGSLPLYGEEAAPDASASNGRGECCATTAKESDVAAQSCCSST